MVAPAEPTPLPEEQVRQLYRLSDPALSELDMEQLLDELLERVHEALAVDTVAILLKDEHSDQLIARAAHGIEEEVERGVRIPIGTGFAGRIAAERVGIFIADVDHADILNPILREKGIRSLLGVPLIVEGELLGVLHVGSLTPREFGPRDVAVLQLAAARAAPAIIRARLRLAVEREHRVAVVLQRSLLPRRLADVWGLSVAARYLPARDGVGGDWYDVIELPRGRLGIAIGDVVGHGVGAAALMGQLRTALRSYAVEGHEPGRVLELVDRFAHDLGDGAMATVAYGVFDGDKNSVTLSNAGHLPPIVVDGTSARAVDVPATSPIGASLYGRYPEISIPLEPGQTLALYTDGLVERPGVEVGESIERLVGLAKGATSAEAACVQALAGMVPVEGPSDDVAIVALENTGIPAELHLRLRAEPQVLAEVRSVLRRWLRDQGAAEDALTEITIAVSEACANVIEHAYSPVPAEFELLAIRQNGDATVTVRDSGSWRAQRGQDRGRGLMIIRTAMDEVDVTTAESGTEISMRRHLHPR